MYNQDLIIAMEVSHDIDDIYAGERYMPIIDDINGKFAKFWIKHKIGIHGEIEKDIERFKNDQKGCIKYCQNCIQELEGLKRNWFTSKDSDAKIDSLIKEYQKKLDELTLKEDLAGLRKQIKKSVKVPPIVLSNETYHIALNYNGDLRKVLDGDISLNSIIKKMQYFAANLPKWISENEKAIFDKAVSLHPDYSLPRYANDIESLSLFLDEYPTIFYVHGRMYCSMLVALSDGPDYYGEDLFEITFSESGKWTCERFYE